MIFKAVDPNYKISKFISTLNIRCNLFIFSHHPTLSGVGYNLGTGGRWEYNSITGQNVNI